MPNLWSSDQFIEQVLLWTLRSATRETPAFGDDHTTKGERKGE